MKGLRLICVLALPLAAQQRSGSSYRYDVGVNGQPLDTATYSLTESPTGSKKIETTRTVSGHTVPVVTTEDKVVRQDGSNKIVDRVIRKYDQDGNPGPPETVRIEERKNADGTTTILATSFRSDLNGNQQMLERATTQVRKGTVTEANTSIERATVNGTLELAEKRSVIEKPAGSGTETQSTVFRRDTNGGFYAAAQEVTKKQKSGSQENLDTARYEVGQDGKLELAERRMGKTTTKPDGSQVVEVNVYSKMTASNAGDSDASTPRLQQQIVTERVKGPNDTIVETTNVRARLPNDPSRFGAFEQIQRTTHVSKDASGREVSSTDTAVGRRDPNGEIVTREISRERAESTKK